MLRNRRYARVRALSKLPCARATTVLGLEHFRATADGGVLALSFVTALLARPWKVGVPCQDHLRECSRRAAAPTALQSACSRDPSAAGIRDAAIVGVLYGTGLRRSEIVKLECSHYKRDRHELTVYSGKGRKDRLV